ncbi:hypothetical protein ES705_05807 [subsurface metagenome]
MKKEIKMSKVFIKNVGKLVSGDLEKGALNANAVYIQDRKIVRVGIEDEIRPNVDGKIVSLRSRNTSMATRTIKLNGVVPSQVIIEKHFYGG